MTGKFGHHDGQIGRHDGQIGRHDGHIGRHDGHDQTKSWKNGALMNQRLSKSNLSTPSIIN